MRSIADYTVVADVGRSLVQLLREQLVPEVIPQTEMIGIGSPADKSDFRLQLFLYSIKHNSVVQKPEMIQRGANAIQYPPMPVNLYYLMTAQSNAEVSVRSLDEHRIMGKAMQTFYDYSILRNEQLLGSLAESNEEVRIVKDEIPTDVLVRLWNFPNVPFRLSVGYVVGPVYIDSQRVRTTKRVLSRDVRLEM